MLPFCVTSFMLYVLRGLKSSLNTDQTLIGIFPEYAESLKKYFEPMEDAKIIRNNKEGEEDIVSQLATVNLIFKSDS